MSFEIKSRVVVLETERPLPGLDVQALDVDMLLDDPLGTGQTDAQGICRITVETGLGQSENPDVTILVRSQGGRVLARARGDFLRDVTRDVSLEIPIPCFRLIEAGVLAPSDLPPDLSAITAAPAQRHFTLLPAAREDALVSELEHELDEAGTVLALCKRIRESLRTSKDNQAVALRKLGKLFEMGRDLPALDGHHYGVVLDLRRSNKGNSLSCVGPVLTLLWGATSQNESPWVGQTFRRADHNALQAVVGTANLGLASRLLGLNHWNRLDGQPNSIAYHALNSWLDLHQAPVEERQAFGYERVGAHFVAGPASSVAAHSPRQVLALNYRWRSLGNRPPLSWLIDEMVQIAEGLYLGQKLFVSRRGLSVFDARRPAEDYGYQPMGYFVLWNSSWNNEARRLFPFLDIPVTAPGLVGSVSVQGSRYRDLKLDPRPPVPCNQRIFTEVKTDLAGRDTLLHLLRDYRNALLDSTDSDSPVWGRLQELFNRAAPVGSMNGFYRGALLGWQGAGLIDLFTRNRLDQVWGNFAARFRSWTGMSFEPLSRERLMEMTDGFESESQPSTWGCNTMAVRTLKERELGHLMKWANIWSEPAAPSESISFGYDRKSFFFIAHADTSVNKESLGKRTYQLNHRWPKLRTISPDCFCIDELVQLSDGLYLGQMMYATDWREPYHPRRSPETYRYGVFGYFLLMDEAWHQLRLRLGFDSDKL